MRTIFSCKKGVLQIVCTEFAQLNARTPDRRVRFPVTIRHRASKAKTYRPVGNLITIASRSPSRANGGCKPSQIIPTPKPPPNAFGRTAAYAALSAHGRFASWLNFAPDGLITWTDGRTM
jgi:hypothetical protein